MRSRSSGPMPALSYASFAALRVSVLMSGMMRSRCVHGSEVSTDAATRMGFVVYWRALSMVQRTAGAAPSPVGQHMYRVLGHETTRALSTSSRPTSVWYCEYGLCMECLWFLTDTFANCS